MKCMLALLCASALAGVCAANVTPIQKVIELLSGMEAKGKEELHAEQVQFAKYSTWCTDTEARTNAEIDEMKMLIEKLGADVLQGETTAEELTKEVNELNVEKTRIEGEMSAATTTREKERGEYDLTHRDYTESLDALEQAITVLK